MDDTNGAAIPVSVVTIELIDRVAQYRTACVALLALVRREVGYLPWSDQMLIGQIERLIDADGARVVQAQLDREKIE